MASNAGSAKIVVLLSTFNGERFLPEQLDSLVNQSCGSWRLLWRDDGSSDRSRAIMLDFAATAGAGRCRQLIEPSGWLGATASFLALLASQQQDAKPLRAQEVVAFADQDDVWLPDKLARGYAALAAVPPTTPALYCARQMLVDEQLNQLGLSFHPHRSTAFPAALAQNVAVGCTVMMNALAAQLVAASRPPSATIHDWWCYILVSAAGGRILTDDAPAVYYRQHPGNLVGAPTNSVSRAFAALRRGPDVFMSIFRQHVDALADQPDILSPAARHDLSIISDALDGGIGDRMRALQLPALRRQTWHESLLFRLWFMLGRAKPIHRRHG